MPAGPLTGQGKRRAANPAMKETPSGGTAQHGDSAAQMQDGLNLAPL